MNHFTRSLNFVMKSCTLLVFAFLINCGSGVSVTVLAQAGQVETNFIFVRHTEKMKDDSRDPELSEAGKERAVNLAKVLLNNYEVAAIYSTPYIRTEKTAQPLADSLGLEIQTYGLDNPPQLLKQIIRQYRGKDILIVGHSNTTPMFINLVLRREQFKELDEKAYGDLFVVTLPSGGQPTVEVKSF